jgi:hypothetical protein
MCFFGADGTQTGEDSPMKMQRFKWAGLMGVLVIAGQSRALAEDGAPSRATLNAMGLSGLSVISDDEAMDIRGEGFGSGGSSAAAWGSSWANVETPFGSAGSENSYDAHGKHSASGSNLSFAGFEITTSGSKGGKDHGSKGGDGGYGGGEKGGKGHGSKGGKGSYGGGGDKGGKSHGSKGGNGSYGGGGDKGSKGYGSKGGSGGYGGGGNNGGSHAPKTTTGTVFAGGSSRAHAK